MPDDPVRIQIDTTSLQVVNSVFDTAERKYPNQDNLQTTGQCIRDFVNGVVVASERYVPLPGNTIGHQNPTIAFWNSPPQGVTVHHLPTLQVGVHSLPVADKVKALGALLEFAAEFRFRTAASSFLAFQAQPSITEEFLSRRISWPNEFPDIADELNFLVARQEPQYRAVYDSTVRWAGGIRLSSRHEDILSLKNRSTRHRMQRGEYLLAFFWDWYQRGYQYRPLQNTIFATAHPLRIYGETRGLTQNMEMSIDWGNAVSIHRKKITESAEGHVEVVLPMIKAMADYVKKNDKELAPEWTAKGWRVSNTTKARYVDIMCDSFRLRKGDVLRLRSWVKDVASNVTFGAFGALLVGLPGPRLILEPITRYAHSQMMQRTKWYPAKIGQAHNALIDVAMSRLTFGHEWSLLNISHSAEIAKT